MSRLFSIVVVCCLSKPLALAFLSLDCVCLCLFAWLSASQPVYPFAICGHVCIRMAWVCGRHGSHFPSRAYEGALRRQPSQLPSSVAMAKARRPTAESVTVTVHRVACGRRLERFCDDVVASWKGVERLGILRSYSAARLESRMCSDFDSSSRWRCRSLAVQARSRHTRTQGIPSFMSRVGGVGGPFAFGCS